jgi:hypothetical protein
MEQSNLHIHAISWSCAALIYAILGGYTTWAFIMMVKRMTQPSGCPFITVLRWSPVIVCSAGTIMATVGSCMEAMDRISKMYKIEC